MRWVLPLLLAALSLVVPCAFADDDAPRDEVRKDAAKPHYDFLIDIQGNLYQIDCLTVEYHKVGQVRIPSEAKSGGATPILCDLANTPDGYLYGISDTSLYLINLTSPEKSRKIGDHGLANPYGMTAVGMTLLVNTSAGEVHTLDRKTAKPTRVGPMGGSWAASGDIAYIGKKLFSSVKDAKGTEHLVRLDEKTGKATRIGAFKDERGNAIPHVYGLIDRAGQLFGVTVGGDIIRIDPKTARCKILKKTNVRWYGATSFTRI